MEEMGGSGSRSARPLSKLTRNEEYEEVKLIEIGIFQHAASFLAWLDDGASSVTNANDGTSHFEKRSLSKSAVSSSALVWPCIRSGFSSSTAPPNRQR
jgi:hypothetical protein